MRLLHIFIIIFILWAGGQFLKVEADVGRTDINEMVSEKVDVSTGLVIDMSCADIGADQEQVLCYVMYSVSGRTRDCGIITEIFTSTDMTGKDVSNAIVQAADEYLQGCVQ